MTVDVVLFDMGGVICRFDAQARLSALARACRIDEQTVRADIFTSGFDRDCDRGLHSAEEVLGRLRRLGFRDSMAELRRLWTLAFQPDPQVLDMVRRSRRGRRTGLLTDNGPVLLDALPLLLPEVAKAFDAHLFSCTLGAVKPDPAIFEAALHRLDVPPARAFFVDDSARNVEAARDAGVRAELFTSAAGLNETLAAAGLLG